MADFHLTPDGKQFYNRTVPRIMMALEKIAKELVKANDLRELELGAKGLSLPPQSEEDS